MKFKNKIDFSAETPRTLIFVIFITFILDTSFYTDHLPFPSTFSRSPLPKANGISLVHSRKKNPGMINALRSLNRLILTIILVKSNFGLIFLKVRSARLRTKWPTYLGKIIGKRREW